MNTELQDMIGAGRKLIAEQATAKDRKPEVAQAVPPPSPLERIAVALKRIADRLDGFSDNSEACDALRVNVLR